MKTFVIIDDELEMETLYELMLESSIEEGLIDLKFFSDARLFTEWLNAHTPDLVFCDLNMPHLSGIEIAKIIREKGLNIPFYFVSGYEPSDYKEVMRELQITQFLAKPLDYDEVLNSINSELGL